jgi:RNA polymerase sigma-70 factor (ECF subfamily)
LQHLAIRESYTKQVEDTYGELFAADDSSNIELQELTKVIQITLKLMPERCAKIFRMNRFEGKKYREIAAILSISVKTVEADMGKALQLFRKTLKEYAGEHQ